MGLNAFLAVQDSSIGDIVSQSVSQTFDFSVSSRSGSIKCCENEYRRSGRGMGSGGGGGMVARGGG